jgi:hypothetical protein
VADGIRIQPQPERVRDLDMRDRMIIVRDLARPLKPNSVQRQESCKTCGIPHTCKTYHFQLDGDGTIMVSTTIWDRLQAMFDHGGFEKVNVVADPPDVHISLEPIRHPFLDLTAERQPTNGHR